LYNLNEALDNSLINKLVFSHAMNAWHMVDRGTAEKITVIIEIPAHSRNKYEIDKDSGLLKLDRVLHASVHYPADYGFVPQSLWEDGDPLDVVVLTRFPVPPMTIVDARPIGIIDMIDNGEGDSKVIAVPADDPLFKEITDIKQLEPHRLSEIVHFFETYKLLEKKKVEITGTRGAAEAREAVEKGFALYDAHFGGECPCGNCGDDEGCCGGQGECGCGHMHEGHEHAHEGHEHKH
jgi:inorganic pyrophosphatase